MKLEIRQAKPEEMVDFKRVAKAALMINNAVEHPHPALLRTNQRYRSGTDGTAGC